MITIDPAVLGSILTVLVGAIALAIRETFVTRSYEKKRRVDAEKSQADGDLITVKANADLLADVSSIAKTASVLAQSVVEVVKDNTRASSENAAHTQGMLLMFKEFQQIVRHAAIGIDETQMQVSDIKTGIVNLGAAQTNLGETFDGELHHIVEELRGIGMSITQTNDRLTDLFTEFRRAERQMIVMLEPYALAQADKIRGQTLTSVTTTEESGIHQQVTTQEIVTP